MRPLMLAIMLLLTGCTRGAPVPAPLDVPRAGTLDVDGGMWEAHADGLPTGGEPCIVELVRADGTAVILADLAPGRPEWAEEARVVRLDAGAWHAEAQGCADWRAWLRPA